MVLNSNPNSCCWDNMVAVPLATNINVVKTAITKQAHNQEAETTESTDRDMVCALLRLETEWPENPAKNVTTARRSEVNNRRAVQSNSERSQLIVLVGMQKCRM